MLRNITDQALRQGAVNHPGAAVEITTQFYPAEGRHDQRLGLAVHEGVCR